MVSCGFNLPFPNYYVTRHLFVGLLVICGSFTEKSIQVFAKFSDWIISPLMSHKAAYIFRTLILCPLDTFPILWLVYIHSNYGDFDEEKFNRVKLMYFFFLLSCSMLCLNLKNPLPGAKTILWCSVCLEIVCLSYLSAHWFKQIKNNKYEFVRV